MSAIAVLISSVIFLQTPPAESSHVADGRRTLRTADGHLLRGTKMVIARGLPEATAQAASEDAWREVRSLGLNAVRLGWADPWYRSHDYDYWTVDEALPAIDASVAHARATGTTVVINYQDVGAFQDGRRDFAMLREFWQAVAPRYADDPLVIYEICNEPAFDQAVYLDESFRGPFLEVYRQVRRDAPDRPVLMFSFNSIDHEMRRIVDAYRDELDWDRTSVAFHLYGGGGTTAAVRDLLEVYPAMCTELDYPGTHPYVQVLDGRAVSVQNCEDLGVSWFDWSGWDDTSFKPVREWLLPDAKAKGYWWGDGDGDGGSELPPLTDFSGTSAIKAASGAERFLVVDGTNVGLSGASATWRLTRGGDGRYRIAAGQGLLTGAEKVGEEPSVIGGNDAWLSQRWRIEPIWGGGETTGWPVEAVRLRCEWTNLCLGRGGDGKIVMLESDDPSSRWRLIGR